MNCKEGDLAVIVRSSYANEGRIVVCLGLVRGVIYKDGLIADSWRVEPWSDGIRFFTHVPDSALRPIHDNPGADESLSWCDVQKKVAA